MNKKLTLALVVFLSVFLSRPALGSKLLNVHLESCNNSGAMLVIHLSQQAQFREINDQPNKVVIVFENTYWGGGRKHFYGCRKIKEVRYRYHSEQNSVWVVVELAPGVNKDYHLSSRNGGSVLVVSLSFSGTDEYSSDNYLMGVYLNRCDCNEARLLIDVMGEVQFREINDQPNKIVVVLQDTTWDEGRKHFYGCRHVKEVRYRFHPEENSVWVVVELAPGVRKRYRVEKEIWIDEHNDRRTSINVYISLPGCR